MKSGLVVSKPLELRTENDGKAPRVIASGELDLSTAEELDAELKRAEASAPETLVLDLRELQFMDSTGLRVLVSAHARVEGTEQRFLIVRPLTGAAIERILAVAGVEQVLDFVDDV